MPNFFILDEREIWWKAACEAAQRAGYKAQRVLSQQVAKLPVKNGDVGFIRPHADWRKLPQNRQDDLLMRKLGMRMVQDRLQVEHYEDKMFQAQMWSSWMPATWLCFNIDTAIAAADAAGYPLVSKAKVGASSVNVRILRSKDEAHKHLMQIFGKGVLVSHGASCPDTMQRGYAILQEFIPHQVTYRVNAVGYSRAVFFRYCYPDKPVAQTGNVEPAFEMTDELESLLDYCDGWFKKANTRWCAIDVLKDERTPDRPWRLLETSLAWPWPSPGRCNEGTFFGSLKNRKWIDIFDVMFDELEAGAWAN